MLHRCTHKIGNRLFTSTNIKIKTLRKSILIKHFIIPVYIRINIGIDSIPSILYNFIRILRSSRWSTCSQSFIIQIHPRRPIHILNPVHRFHKRILYCYVNSCTSILHSLFSSNQHNSICTTCTINSSGRGILQN